MTVTLKEQFTAFWPQSVAVQVTVEVPVEKALPLGGTQSTAKRLQRSVRDKVPTSNRQGSAAEPGRWASMEMRCRG